MEDKDKKSGSLKVQSSVVTNWNEVPSAWKKTTPIKEVKFVNSPYDKALLGIFKPFFSQDELRPVMTAIHFDDRGITATDAHKLITLPFPNKSYKGNYKTPIFDALAKKSSSLGIKGDLIDGKYPSYDMVIPYSGENMPYAKVIDVYKLLQYTNVALEYANVTTHQIKIKVPSGETYGLNGSMLVDCLEALLKLGHERVYFHYALPNRACVLSPSKSYVLGNDIIVLLMPVMLNSSDSLGANDMDYAREITVYFDVAKNEIINGDGSVAKFQMTYPNNSVLSDEQIKLLYQYTKLNHAIVILETFAVKDGKAMASDLRTNVVLFVDSRIPNGLYTIKNGAIEFEKHKDLDDYPILPKIDEKDYISYFTIDTDYFKYVLSKAVQSLSKDELRPAMTGFCLDRKGDDLFLVTTNAHVLFKMNMKDYVDFKSKNDFQIILPKGFIQQFLNFTQSKSITIKSTDKNSIFESKEGEYISRNIDQRYPNYDAVIRQYSEFALTLDIKELKGCLKEKIAIDFIKKHKAQKSGSIIAKKIDETRAEVMIVAMDNTGNYATEIERTKICEIIYRKKEGDFTSTDSVALLMPKKIDEEVLFCFALDFFDDLLDVCTSDKIELYEKDRMSAYIVPFESIAYENTNEGKSKSKKSVSKTVTRQLKSDKAKEVQAEPKEEVKEPIIVEPIIVEPIIVEPKEIEGTDSSEKDFLTDKIEAFNMMLDIEDDKKEVKFLTDKIEAFEMMLEMESDTEEPKEALKKKDIVKKEITEPKTEPNQDQELIRSCQSQIYLNTDSDGKKNQIAKTAEYIRDFDLENDTLIKARYKELLYWVKKMMPKEEEDNRLRDIPLVKKMDEKVSKTMRDYADAEQKKGNHHHHHKTWSDKEFGLTKEELFINKVWYSSSDVLAHEISAVKKLQKAIEDGTLQDPLIIKWAERILFVMNLTFIPIAIKFEKMKDNISVKRELTEKEKFQREMQKIRAEIRASMPNINVKVLENLVEQIEESIKPLKEIVFKKEVERYQSLIDYTVKTEKSLNKLRDEFRFGYDKIFFGELVQRVSPSGYTGWSITDIKLQSNYKEVIINEVGEYVERLGLKLIFAVISNFNRVTNPIESVTKKRLSVGDGGFEGSYLIKFVDGSKTTFTTKAIGAGGYKIQVYHYRYISDFVENALPNGKKGSFYEIAYAKK